MTPGLKKITFDTVTGKIVNPRQIESFTGRFMTRLCYWNGDDWTPCPDEYADMERLTLETYPARRQDGALSIFTARNGASLTIDRHALTWAQYGADGLMIGYNRGLDTLTQTLNPEIPR